VLSSLPSLQELRVLGRRPSLPPGQRIYAVGDIHGRLDLLNELLARIDADIALRPTFRPVYVFLGDYIDRGPSSRETIDRLIEHGETNESIFLRGNHELIAIKCLSDRSLFDQWLRLGGLETLVSYGVSPEILANGKQISEIQSAFHSALSQTHFRFFRDLQSSFVCGDFFFAHAGAKPNVELSQQK
jgi:serine/threonine protein phosphatase 1